MRVKMCIVVVTGKESMAYYIVLLGLQLTTCKVGFVVDRLKVADCVLYQFAVGGLLLTGWSKKNGATLHFPKYLENY